MDYTLHLTSRNKSALALYGFYRKIGIKNADFLLRIYDRELINVDPYNPRLSKEVQARVIAECIRNPWYYFREISRIPTPGGHSKCIFNRGNVAQLWCCLNSINFLEMLPRQQGKTQGIIAAIGYLNNFILTNSDITFSNKEFGDSKLNIKRYKKQMELLPSWLIPAVQKKDGDAVEKYYLSANNNTINALSTAINPTAADKLGRGLTTPIVWWDE